MGIPDKVTIDREEYNILRAIRTAAEVTAYVDRKGGRQSLITILEAAHEIEEDISPKLTRFCQKQILILHHVLQERLRVHSMYGPTKSVKRRSKKPTKGSK
jgi:hypothetical protein